MRDLLTSCLTSLTLAALVGGGVALDAGPALADDAGALGLGLKAVVSGKEMPAIMIQPQTGIKSLKVSLKRSDGKTLKLRSGAVRAGQQKALKIKQPAGVFTYEATFDVVWADKKKSNFTTSFKATRTGRLAMDISAGDVDMDARRLRFRLTNPAKRAELVILGERGKRLDTVEVDFDGADPGKSLEVTWDPVEGDIIKMELKAWDIANFWVGMEITPFSIEIPHEEVVFETGKSNIRASEAPKLQATMGHIQEALAKHGTLLQLKLFVAGYTDTVGPRDANLALSNQRARSIAAWFRANGLKIPIYYQGFGEAVLAKQTPDETEEAANRRALYILSSQRPPAAGQTPTDRWKRL